MKLFFSLPTRKTNTQVWRLAFPIILSNVTVPLLGIVDTAVVGHLPDPHYMGAVAVGAMIFGVLFWGFGFLRMSTTGLTAQAFGADNADELRAVPGRAFILALVFAALLLLMQTPVVGLAFSLVGAEALVEQQGRLYYFIRILSAPATLVNYVILGWFLGMQNARMPLLLLVIVNALNMVLDLVFVNVTGMGADGVAWASVIAEYVGLVCGLALMARELKRHPGNWHLPLLLDREKLRRMVSLNKDIFIRTLCLMFTLAFFTTQGARQGELVLAANAALFQLHFFMVYGLDGFSHAAEALVGRAVGSRDRQAFAEVVTSAGLWAVLMSVTFALLYFFAGGMLVALITDISAVREVASHYRVWIALLPLTAVWGFVMDGVFLGATRAREMRNTMLMSTLLVFVPAWYLLQGLGNHGLWLAFNLFMLARGVSMTFIYLRLHRSGGFVRE